MRRGGEKPATGFHYPESQYDPQTYFKAGDRSERKSTVFGITGLLPYPGSL